MNRFQTLLSISTCAATAWSPDGTRLAFASDDSAVHVWDVTTGREVATLEGYGGIAHSCAW